MRSTREFAFCAVLAMAAVSSACASTVVPDLPGAHLAIGDAGFARSGDASTDPLDARRTRVVCVLATGGTCEVGHVCDAGPCNACECMPDGSCRWAGCMADASSDAPVPAGCRSSTDCRAPEQCHFAVAGCGVPGVCGIDPECDAPVPYCGCDGMTIEACPGAAPRTWASPGPCESPLVLCDPTRVACAIDPPECPPGEVSSVVGACWGACVPISRCELILCGDAYDNCPVGMTCPSPPGGELAVCVAIDR